MSQESAALAVRESSEISQFMPALSVEMALERHRMINEVISRVLKPNEDYGAIPGAGTKKVLLKPGAEKLTTFFGLTKRFQIVERIEDWSGAEHDGEPFFYYLYRCQLWRGDLLVAESDGSCNSHETKYRWRKAERKCPNCNQPTVFKSKQPGEGWFCWAKKGGCGATFAERDPDITGQETGRIANPDIADQVNTIQKMSQKRALVAATLLAVNASDFFTQDVDDGGVIEAQPSNVTNSPQRPAQSAPTRVPSNATPPTRRAPAPAAGDARNGRAVIRKVEELRDRCLQFDVSEAVLNEKLTTYGVGTVAELTSADAQDYVAWLSEQINGALNAAAAEDEA